MDKMSFELLRFVQKNHSVPYIDVLNAFDPVNNVTLTDMLLKALLHAGYLRSAGNASPPICELKLTPDGSAALLEQEEQYRREDQKRAEDKAAEAVRLKERAEDHTDAERRYRTQNKIAVVMPMLTFFLGLLAEHFLGIIRFVMLLFRICE